MNIVFANVCSQGGIHRLSLEIAWSNCCLLYDPTQNLSRAILACIAGLDPITDGELYIDEVPIDEYLSREPLLKNFCYAFDKGVMLANLTLWENLLLPIQWLNPNVNQKELAQKCHELLSQFRLALDISKRPAAFLPGELKLFSYARAFLINSRHYLLDDPFYELNKTERELLYKYLYQAKQERPLLIASIDDEFGKSFADEIIDLSNFKENWLIS